MDAAKQPERVAEENSAGTWLRACAPPDGGSRDLRAAVLEALAAREALSSKTVTELDSGRLTALAQALGALRREVDVALAVVAHAQAERSSAEAPAHGLARQRGHATPGGMVARQTGGTHHEADRLIRMGAELAHEERRAHGHAGAANGAGVGERGQGHQPSSDKARHPGSGSEEGSDPTGGGADHASAASDSPHFPTVTRAVRAGTLSMDAAHAITRMLREVHGRCSLEHWESAERELVSKAQVLSYAQLTRVVRRYADSLDSARREEHAERQRELRYLVMNEDKDGMLVINGKLDPETAAPFKSAVDAMVAYGFRERRRRLDEGRASSIEPVDQRSPGQMRADALGVFSRHLLACEAQDLPLAGARVVVRMTLEQLRDGGGAQVDGAAGAIDAGATRRMAARAGIVPLVLGSGSQVLDLGREVRLFSRAQKTALIERDGGCAKCGAPPSWCDAHHIKDWASGGRTDLSNGVMLCVRCHHDVHRQGWGIRATATEVWFTPPRSVDRSQRPRPGGTALFGSPPPGSGRTVPRPAGPSHISDPSDISDPPDRAGLPDTPRSPSATGVQTPSPHARRQELRMTVPSVSMRVTPRTPPAPDLSCRDHIMVHRVRAHVRVSVACGQVGAKLNSLARTSVCEGLLERSLAETGAWHGWRHYSMRPLRRGS